MKKMGWMIVLAVLLCIGVCCLSACGGKREKDLLLHLEFNEGSGKVVKDSSGRLQDANLNYIFNNAKYKESCDPEWRSSGAVGGSLLMDGYSNFVRYDAEDLSVSGTSFSVSVWVAPRQFEWDDPNAVKNDTEKLTAIVSQFNKSSNQGFILGYHRHGAWSFQVGLGDRWIEVWDDGNPLDKYEWNYITATFDGLSGKIVIYKNGQKINEKAVYENAAIAAAYDIPLFVGRNNEPGSSATASFNMHGGLIDELKLYSSVLDESRITKEFQKGLKDGELKEITFEDIWLQDILTDDVHKPQYHGGPPQHWMNEPHAPMYYNGKYHLFFQFNLFGPYFRNICWGHLVSDDMVNWKALKEVITPTAGSVAPDGIWSGGVAYDNNGIPALFFTAGNDSFASSGLISNQNIGMARPKDITDPNLTEWEVDSELVIKQTDGAGRRGDFRDPHVWKEGDEWFMTLCSAKTSGGTGGTALLYTTKDDSFKNWTFRGSVFEMKNQPGDLGETWELPVLLPLSYADGSASGKHIFIMSPAPADRADNDIFYWIGTFNKTTYKFNPDFAEPKLIDYGNNVFTGPSGFVDPKTGKTVIFSIMQDQRKPNDQYLSGWAHNVGLAREIWLSENNTLKVRAVSELDAYKTKVLEFSDKTLAEANALLKDVQGDMLHIKVEIENKGSTNFGIYVRKNADNTERTAFIYDAATNMIGVNTGMSGDQNISGYFKGDLALDNNIISMDIYLDRSQIEGFFNENLAISARIYPTDPASKGISLFADSDILVKSMVISKMESIHL